MMNEYAQTLSQYGLYAIVAALTVAVVYLYKRTVSLEKEMRTTLIDMHKTQSEMIAQARETISKNTEAIDDMRAIIQTTAHTFDVMSGRMQGYIQKDEHGR